MERVPHDVDILSVAVPHAQSDVVDQSMHMVAGPSASYIDCETCDIVGRETNAAVEHANDHCRPLSDNSVLQSAACETVSAAGNQLTMCNKSDR